MEAPPDLFADAPAMSRFSPSNEAAKIDILTIEVPGEVRGKGRPRFARRGAHMVAYTDQKTESYESLVRLSARGAMVRAGAEMIGRDIPLGVRMTAYFVPPASKPKKWQAAALAGQHRPTKKPDPDNITKIIDALNSVVWADDVQVVEIAISKRYATEPGLVIEVWRL
jgi:Holliday junction resolvase RusA-like endonuclease